MNKIKRMNLISKLMRHIILFFLIFAITFIFECILAPTKETSYAATTKTIAHSTTIICNRTGTVKIPKGYKNCKFSSSNPKVASISNKGKLKALRLGITKITMRSGTKQRTYTITVIPQKKSDVQLNQKILVGNQKTTLKLVSNKYDTSQVQLRFEGVFSEIDEYGRYKGCSDEYDIVYGDLSYWYGDFKKNTTQYICSKDTILNKIFDFEYQNDIYAGLTYDTQSLEWDQFDKKTNYQQLKKMGLKIQINGKDLKNQYFFSLGTNTISIIAGNQRYDTNIDISYTIKDALLKKDATGFSEGGKQVFDEVFAVTYQIIQPGMSEQEKVKAIHDYLVYSANYVNNGDYEHAENWAYGASGVLLHKEGVCQSYAVAFYMLAISANLDCHYVSGTIPDGRRHAWNQVKVNGTWYYIDCTWDDPVGGGHENYTYYLSQTLWSDHMETLNFDLSDDGRYIWEHSYLTGR